MLSLKFVMKSVCEKKKRINVNEISVRKDFSWKMQLLHGVNLQNICDLHNQTKNSNALSMKMLEHCYYYLVLFKN